MPTEPEVPPPTLLSGALFALEQCGRLLEDAVILVEHSRYTTAAGVALLAREEMGKHRLLLDFWREAVKDRSVSRTHIKETFEKHVRKQESAQLSLTYRAPHGTGLERLLREGMAAGTPAYAGARAQVEDIDRKKEQRQPHDRHEHRMRAFYVDLADSGSGWLRPCEFMSPKAFAEIVDAINDYAMALDRVEQAAPIHQDQELADAIAALSPQVLLPRPPRIPPEIQARLLAIE